MLCYNTVRLIATLKANKGQWLTSYMYGLSAVGESHVITVETFYFPEAERAVCYYEIEDGQLNLLDVYRNPQFNKCPATDNQANIFIPCQDSVAVFRITNNRKLVFGRNLTGDGKLLGKSVNAVAVVNDSTLCLLVGSHVYLLDIITDTVLIDLQSPAAPWLTQHVPQAVASTSGFILIAYQYCPEYAKLSWYEEAFSYSERQSPKGWNMLLYEPGHTYRTLLKTPYLQSVESVSVDSGGRFLVADSAANTIWVLSLTGEVVGEVNVNAPCYISPSTDGKRLYIAKSWDVDVAVFE